MRKILTIHIFVTLLLCGCSGRNDDTAATLESQSVDLMTVDDKFVIARIGNQEITKADVKRQLDFESEIWKIKNRKLSVDSYNHGLKRFRAVRQNKMIPQVVNYALIDQYVADKNIVFDEGEMNSEITDFFRNLSYRKGIDAFASEIGFDREYCVKRICNSKRVESILAASGDVSVTEEEIDAGLKRLDDYYERATASNSVTWVSCSNALARISSGEEFSAVAKSLPEGNAEATRWYSFFPWEIENAALRKWAFSAPIGSIKEFDIEDGLSIVKILSRADGAMVQSMAAENEAEVELARINFTMLETEPEPRTREHVRDELSRWKRRNSQKAFFDVLMNDLELTFPHGTNIIIQGEL